MQQLSNLLNLFDNTVVKYVSINTLIKLIETQHTFPSD